MLSAISTRLLTRSVETGHHQFPSSLRELATIAPSATVNMRLAFSTVTPLPTIMGRFDALLMVSSSRRSGSPPVLLASGYKYVRVEELGVERLLF